MNQPKHNIRKELGTILNNQSQVNIKEHWQTGIEDIVAEDHKEQTIQEIGRENNFNHLQHQDYNVPQNNNDINKCIQSWNIIQDIINEEKTREGHPITHYAASQNQPNILAATKTKEQIEAWTEENLIQTEP